MAVHIIRGFFILLSTLTGYYLSPEVRLLGVLIGLFGSLVIIGLEILMVRVPVKKMVLAIGGLIIGLVTAILLANFLLLVPMEDPMQGNILRFALYFAFSYLGIMYAIKGVEELGFVLPFLHGSKGPEQKLLIVDTSVLIDGRVYELALSGFLDYTIVIPRFIIRELHGLSDCSSELKRQRGRRGLDVLNRLRKDDRLDVKIYDMEFPDIEAVDSKLVKMASQLKAAILTNDFNLMKVAEVQNIRVLNLNSLATLMRPRLMSGEEISLKIVKEGKESGQGVGYLEDGTMVVVENGALHIGKIIDIVIDSAIQTTTGRIIFAKLKTETR
ncbi:MAG: PIN domain-containing protein [Candidatus Omnitrophica bacterium]|nr:PIN domain-containing protein [Candidatus Omnitrophota bacterium]